MITTSTAIGALWKSGGLAVQLNENFIRAGDEEPEICALQTYFMIDFCIIPQSQIIKINTVIKSPSARRKFLFRKGREVSSILCPTRPCGTY